MIEEREYQDAANTGNEILAALTEAFKQQQEEFKNTYDNSEGLTSTFEESLTEFNLVRLNGEEIIITLKLDDELLSELEKSKKNGFEILNLIGKELQIELGEQINAENTGLEIMSIKLLQQLEENKDNQSASKEYAIQLSVKASASKGKGKTNTNTNKASNNRG